MPSIIQRSTNRRWPVSHWKWTLWSVLLLLLLLLLLLQLLLLTISSKCSQLPHNNNHQRSMRFLMSSWWRKQLQPWRRWIKPAQVTRGALVAHRYTYAQPRCRTLQYSRILIPFWCPSGTILLALFLMVWHWRVSRAGPMLLYWHKLLYHYYSLLLSFPFSSFCL